MSAEAGARGGRPDGGTRRKPATRDGPRPRTTREKLLDAAAALFAERGYRTVTLDDIGGAVGISGPAVYRHFKSKESLLGELLVDVSQHLLSNAKERVSSFTNPVEALVALVDFHVDFAVANPALITVQARELSSLAPEDQQRVRRLQRSYVEFWAGAILQTGRVARREDAIAAAHATFGLVNSTPFSGRLDGQQMRVLLHSLALSGLAPSVHDDPRQPENDNRPENNNQLENDNRPAGSPLRMGPDGSSGSSTEARSLRSSSIAPRR